MSTCSRRTLSTGLHNLYTHISSFVIRCSPMGYVEYFVGVFPNEKSCQLDLIESPHIIQSNREHRTSSTHTHINTQPYTTLRPQPGTATAVCVHGFHLILNMQLKAVHCVDTHTHTRRHKHANPTERSYDIRFRSNLLVNPPPPLPHSATRSGVACLGGRGSAIAAALRIDNGLARIDTQTADSGGAIQRQTETGHIRLCRARAHNYWRP